MLFNSKDDKLSSFHNNARTHSADTEFSLVDDIDELRRDMVGCLINDRHVSLLKFGQRFEGQPFMYSTIVDETQDKIEKAIDRRTSDIRPRADELFITDAKVTINYVENLDVGDESPYSKNVTNWDKLNENLEEQHKKTEKQQGVIGSKGRKYDASQRIRSEPGKR